MAKGIVQVSVEVQKNSIGQGGLDVYFWFMKIKECFLEKNLDTIVTIQGWVKTRRDSKGGFSFVEVNDGSCLKGLQVIADGTLPNYSSDVLSLYPGSSVEVEGKIIASMGKKQGVELQAHRLIKCGDCSPDHYIIGKQKLSFETLREYQHLRPRTNTFGVIARVRNHLSFAIHKFFQERGFLYIHTPIITNNDCEGAGELFRVDAGKEGNFFGKPAFLTVSGQLEVEPFACSLGDVYTFGPTFRAENSHTSRHLSEFWMVEPEMAFADLDKNQEVAEEFLKYLLQSVLTQLPADLEFLNTYIEKNLIDKLEGVLNNPFERITYTKAVEILSQSSESFQYPITWGADLQSEHERYLTEKYFNRPVIVTNYPATLKPFYMKVDEGGKTVRAMDILVPGVGEIIGGSQREENLEVLLARMKLQGIEPASLEWYADLRRFGTVIHSGFGLGFERLIQFVTGMGNIRDVIPYPRSPGKI